MKPLFKYSGGKSAEVAKLGMLIPEGRRVVEPFAGSAALSFHRERPAVVCDTRANVTDAMRCVRDPVLFWELVDRLERLRGLGKNDLEDEYYRVRDRLFGSDELLDRAYRWIVIRQLTYSGMDRTRSRDGKINSPFGHYRHFVHNVTRRHHELLQSWEILCDDFETALDRARPDDVVFLDPPYLERNSAYGAASDEALHTRLREAVGRLRVPFALIHVDCDFYREAYENYDVFEYDKTYAQNYAGAAIKNGKVRHLLISNATG